jgi:TRAP-type C4-dicarboxylate transport system permease large subunit
VERRDRRRVRDDCASAGILLIVAVAALGWILSVEQVPQRLTGAMPAISANPYGLLLS